MIGCPSHPVRKCRFFHHAGEVANDLFRYESIAARRSRCQNPTFLRPRTVGGGHRYRLNILRWPLPRDPPSVKQQRRLVDRMQVLEHLHHVGKLLDIVPLGNRIATTTAQEGCFPLQPSAFARALPRNQPPHHPIRTGQGKLSSRPAPKRSPTQSVSHSIPMCVPIHQERSAANRRASRRRISSPREPSRSSRAPNRMASPANSELRSPLRLLPFHGSNSHADLHTARGKVGGRLCLHLGSAGAIDHPPPGSQRSKGDAKALHPPVIPTMLIRVLWPYLAFTHAFACHPPVSRAAPSPAISTPYRGCSDPRQHLRLSCRRAT